jgi:hypothetical protein
MKIQCSKCNARFDDEFRTTICPHETFAANDGRNNFAHHPETPLDDGRCPCGFNKADCVEYGAKCLYG